MWSTGQFWDLFLAGCYEYERDESHERHDPERYTESAVRSRWPGLPLAEEATLKGSRHFFWDKEKSDELAVEIAALAEQSGTLRPWTFSGPVDLVTVGARRAPDGEIQLDWAGRCSTSIRALDLPLAIAHYTGRAYHSRR